MTIDLNHTIHIWDTLKETTEVFQRIHTEKIIAVCEIMFLKLVAMSSVDQQLIFWDPKTRAPSKQYRLTLKKNLSA